jgi:hypothetical protein
VRRAAVLVLVQVSLAGRRREGKETILEIVRVVGGDVIWVPSAIIWRDHMERPRESYMSMRIPVLRKKRIKGRKWIFTLLCIPPHSYSRNQVYESSQEKDPTAQRYEYRVLEACR